MGTCYAVFLLSFFFLRNTHDSTSLRYYGPISTPWNRWIFLLSPISFFLFKLTPHYAHANVLLPSSPMISAMKIHVPLLIWISNIWHGWMLFPPWNTFFAWLSGYIFPRAASQFLSCCFLITQPLNDGIFSGLLALELHFPILVYMYIHICLPIYHDSYLGHAICNQTILNLSSLIEGSHSRYLSMVGCLGALPHIVPSLRHKLIEQLPSEALPITLANCALISRASTQE